MSAPEQQAPEQQALEQKFHFASAGFWLPCYQSSFFSHTDDRANLRPRYHFTTTGSGPFADRAAVKLEANIFSRLLMVLPHKHYTSAYPITGGSSAPPVGEAQPDPVGILFLADNPRALAGFEACPVKCVTLFANQDGFYVWTVAYEDGKTKKPSVEAALKAHIFDLVGGDFASHHSGIESEKHASIAVPVSNLKRYRDEHLGMLTFFQLNIILEGLHNVNLDPRVFFKSEPGIEKEYTLGGFARQVTALFDPAKRPPHRVRPAKGAHKQEAMEQARKDEAAQDEVAQQTVASFFTRSLEDPATLDWSALQAFADLCVSPRIQAHILDEFLAVTEVLTLKRMKQRIERCRRALLEELIEVTHRRDPLVQAEPPDGPIDRIEEVTEAQLRGYIMLVAAKMPLVANVLLHLDDLHYAHPRKAKAASKNAANAIADPTIPTSETYGPYHSWTGLLRALQYDLTSLIEAISQARTDRMLYEQEQIHAEQETLAEIQRLNERSGGAISPAHSVAISVMSNLLALFAVVLAAGPLIKNGRVTFNLEAILTIFNANNLPGALALVLLGIMLIAIYALIHFAAQRVLRVGYRIFKRDFQLDAKYYYEIDARVDAPFQLGAIAKLLDHGAPHPLKPPQRKGLVRLLGFLPVELSRAARREINEQPYKYPRRNSYRVERLEKSEALHKIYIETSICVSERRHIKAVLVYELLFHRPSKEHDYIFKDLRVVSTHAAELTREEIITLKQVVADYFINPCLEMGWRFMAVMPSSDNYDALFTITQPLETPPEGT
ncbi:MAG: hypothetical protein IVW57_03740 [Ktedonobacterales bacterium]|nr:hypothetical protein [Ktedonobacterales bacterium]